MNEIIKIDYTDEEVKQYIEALNAAIGNKDKINELLGFNNLPIFVSYLRCIGVNEILLSYAGVVEIARHGIKRTLESKYFKGKVTDKGVLQEKYEQEGLKRYHYVDEDGILHMHEFYEFSMPDEEGKVFYFFKSKDGTKKVEKEIDKNGIIKLTYNYYGGDGWYTEERIDKNGVPIIEVDTTDGATFGRLNRYIDTGYVYFIESDANRSYKQNYDIYTALFPNTKGWFNDNYKGTVEEVSERLEIERAKLKVEELKNEIYRLSVIKARGVDKDLDKKRNEVKRLLGFLLTVQEKSLVGKKAAENILSEVKKVPIPKKEIYKLSSVYIDPLDGENINGIDVNDNEDENLDGSNLSEKEKLEMEKRKLIKTILQLRDEIMVSYGKNKYYDDIINLINTRIKQIPVIGKIIGKIARKHTVNPYINVDDIVL